MARTCDELDSEPFDIVDRVVERVDFQLTTIAGAGIHMPNAQCAPQEGANPLLQNLAYAQLRINRRRGLRHNTYCGNSFDGFEHDGSRFRGRARYRTS